MLRFWFQARGEEGPGSPCSEGSWFCSRCCSSRATPCRGRPARHRAARPRARARRRARSAGRRLAPTGRSRRCPPTPSSAPQETSTSSKVQAAELRRLEASRRRGRCGGGAPILSARRLSAHGTTLSSLRRCDHVGITLESAPTSHWLRPTRIIQEVVSARWCLARTTSCSSTSAFTLLWQKTSWAGGCGRSPPACTALPLRSSAWRRW
mmetsp:Transcript_29354/g.84055  ORF Transcript_29354/g.84055 Transcript_29354/m.84055 type:complete len:209 (-) Transcript_29354:564-1190(-)